MKPHRNLAVLDAADLVAADINRLTIANPGILHVQQPRDSAQSIGANISEGFGRGPGADRGKYLRVSRASAEETIRHLWANRDVGLIDSTQYWRLHHRLVTISKMLSKLILHPDSQARPRKRVPRKRLGNARRESALQQNQLSL
jgi:four helix bundle protein